MVSVHEVGREGDTLYIVSDFIEGAKLKDWLTAPRLTPREAAELCIKIAEALHQAHEAGVIHRDLKPGNIMIDMAGEPHITDFGSGEARGGRDHDDRGGADLGDAGLHVAGAGRRRRRTRPTGGATSIRWG